MEKTLFSTKSNTQVIQYGSKTKFCFSNCFIHMWLDHTDKNINHL